MNLCELTSGQTVGDRTQEAQRPFTQIQALYHPLKTLKFLLQEPLQPVICDFSISVVTQQ